MSKKLGYVTSDGIWWVIGGKSYDVLFNIFTSNSLTPINFDYKTIIILYM